MHNLIFIIFAVAQMLLAQNVKIHGALKSIMHGDLKGNFNLQELEGKKNVYGLGAVENLKGEIIVLNSKPFVSLVKEESVVTDSTFNHKAALFAFSRVDTWKTDSIDGELNITELENVIAEKAERKPESLTFLIEGKVKSLKWHVIDWVDGDTIHTHQKHKTAGLHGELKDEQVTIVGFYSADHKGVLTHRNSNLHMHFINKDKSLAGHVDHLQLTKALFKTAYENH